MMGQGSFLMRIFSDRQVTPRRGVCNLTISLIAIAILAIGILYLASTTDKLSTNRDILTVQSAWAQQPQLSSNDVELKVTSQQHVHDVAGQFITVGGAITNLSPTQTIKGGIAYISLVDLNAKIPVDLEDWSAEKGLYIPSLAPSQSLPLEWKVRLVKAGSYTIDVLFNKDGDLSSPPAASSKVFLEVAPKLNLNPGNVLPVAFGVPTVLLIILGTTNYVRGKKVGVYR